VSYKKSEKQNGIGEKRIADGVNNKLEIKGVENSRARRTKES
jgi:hypothetical protein